MGGDVGFRNGKSASPKQRRGNVHGANLVLGGKGWGRLFVER